MLSPTQNTPVSSHQQPVQTNQIAFCWSGDKIFVTTAEGRARILSYPGFEPVLHLEYGDERREFELNGHTSSCLTAELQPTGRYLATGGSDSIIALWDTTDWICQRTLTKMVGPVRSISKFWETCEECGCAILLTMQALRLMAAMLLAVVMKVMGWRFRMSRRESMFIHSRRLGRVRWLRGRRRGIVWRIVIWACCGLWESTWIESRLQLTNVESTTWLFGRKAAHHGYNYSMRPREGFYTRRVLTA